MGDGRPIERLYPHQIQALAEARRPPPLSASAFLLHDVASDQTLWEVEAEAPRAPASLNKLMTALLVVEQANLDTRVTIMADDLVGGSTVGLETGEVRTVEELLYGMLLPSGNDAAVALARHVGGSVDEFVNLMNDRAVALGLAQTHFENPHGFDHPQQTTTARDLLRLSQVVLENAVLARMVATDEQEIAGRRLQNRNELLGVLPGADGIKTGTTPAAGENLALSVTQNRRQVIIVLLGSTRRYQDARALLRHYNTHYRWDEPAVVMSRLQRWSNAESQRWLLHAPRGPAQFLPAWQWQLVRPVRVVRTNLETGGPVATLRWYLGRQRLVEVAMEAQRLERSSTRNFSIFGAVAGLPACADAPASRSVSRRGGRQADRATATPSY